uniref:Uncharacterized protein n=1 Tax=Ananas comosus var. bracteatus TaxID=296719 RepID=A0A6V7NTK6_ANACO|nr:unnamed protein product [Ananas comosus var. bracteatus]
MGGSWVRTITSPFRKACSSSSTHPTEIAASPRVQLLCLNTIAIWSNQPLTSVVVAAAAAAAAVVAVAGHHKTDQHGMILHGEVMACGYEDVRVMWSILDRSTTNPIAAAAPDPSIARSCSGGAASAACFNCSSL